MSELTKYNAGDLYYSDDVYKASDVDKQWDDLVEKIKNQEPQDHDIIFTRTEILYLISQIRGAG